MVCDEKQNRYLEGTSIFLRPYESEIDEEALYKSTFVDEINVMTGNTTPFTRRQVRDYVQKIGAGDASRIDFVIARLTDGSPVGEIVLNEISDRNANIRLCIFDKDDFGKGYGSEAILLTLGYGFGMKGLHRISLSVYEHNTRGLHVYEKIGFKKEGVLRETLFMNHKYVNEVVMSMLEDEYRERYMK